MFSKLTITTILVFSLLPLQISAFPAPFHSLSTRMDDVPQIPIQLDAEMTISTLMESTSQVATSIDFTECPSSGAVTEITITPCEAGRGTSNDPCHFHSGR